jgi:hypothetical protein
MQSPADTDIVVFIGTEGVDWVSEDCGSLIRVFNTGKKIQEFVFHPFQKMWALAASWTTCLEYELNCHVYKEVFFTTNLGREWNFMQSYVFDFEWAASPSSSTIPEQRVFLTKDEHARGH